MTWTSKLDGNIEDLTNYVWENWQGIQRMTHSDRQRCVCPHFVTDPLTPAVSHMGCQGRVNAHSQKYLNQFNAAKKAKKYCWKHSWMLISQGENVSASEILTLCLLCKSVPSVKISNVMSPLEWTHYWPHCRHTLAKDNKKVKQTLDFYCM